MTLAEHQPKAGSHNFGGAEGQQASTYRLLEDSLIFLFQGLPCSLQEQGGQCCESQGVLAGVSETPREEEAQKQQFSNRHRTFKKLTWLSQCMLSEYLP